MNAASNIKIQLVKEKAERKSMKGQMFRCAKIVEWGIA
jgi:hypothetical protein